MHKSFLVKNHVISNASFECYKVSSSKMKKSYQKNKNENTCHNKRCVWKSLYFVPKHSLGKGRLHHYICSLAFMRCRLFNVQYLNTDAHIDLLRPKVLGNRLSI